jgi:hypothetical protein
MSHIITSPLLQNIEHIEHAFFTKQIPGSSNKYLLKDDTNPEEVMHNRALVAAGRQLCLLRQIHSNKALLVDKPYELGSEAAADAMVTTIPGLMLGIVTADCAPILLVDKVHRIIGAAHAGWRGARADILANTILLMEQQGSKRSDIIAVIGPTIQQNFYEIGPEFHQDFLDEDAGNNIFFKSSPKVGHFMFDLPSYVSHKLQNAGITTIDDIHHDTYSDPDNFVSYRRATLEGKPYISNQLSMITIKE